MNNATVAPKLRQGDHSHTPQLLERVILNGESSFGNIFCVDYYCHYCQMLLLRFFDFQIMA